MKPELTVLDQIVRALAAVDDPTVDDRDYTPSSTCGLCGTSDPVEYEHILNDPAFHERRLPERSRHRVRPAVRDNRNGDRMSGVAEPSDAAMRLMDTVQFALDAAEEAGLSDSYSVAPRVVGALFTDANFNDIIRVLGGKLAGLDRRMTGKWGSSVLFTQGADNYIGPIVKDGK